jgi:hypothetical protein
VIAFGAAFFVGGVITRLFFFGRLAEGERR